MFSSKYKYKYNVKDNIDKDKIDHLKPIENQIREFLDTFYINKPSKSSSNVLKPCVWDKDEASFATLEYLLKLKFENSPTNYYLCGNETRAYIEYLGYNPHHFHLSKRDQQRLISDLTFENLNIDISEYPEQLKKYIIDTLDVHKKLDLISFYKTTGKIRKKM